MREIRPTAPTNSFFDVNGVLAIVENSKPHVVASSAALSVALRERMITCLSSHCVTTILSMANKSLTKTKALESVDWLLEHVVVLAEDQTVLRLARNLRRNDCEDAVVAAAATVNGCDHILTRNIVDVSSSPVKAITPEEFILALEERN